MITIIKDIDLYNDIEKYDVILVGTNTYQKMTNGFQEKVRKKYPFVYNLNLETKYADKNKMGTRVTTKGSTPIFSLCFITYGYSFRPDLSKDFLDYESLEKCLKTANNEFKGLKVATTIMGSYQYDGSGDKDRILELLTNNSDKIDLYVYDYQQLKTHQERAKIFKENTPICKGNREVCKEIVRQQVEERSKLEVIEEVGARKKRIKKEINDLLKR